MRSRDPALEPELEAFLETRPIVRRVPPEMRERALAGARAILAADGVIAPPPRVELPARRPMPVARGRGPLWIAVAASVVVAVGGAAVGALAALYGRTAQTRQVASQVSHPPVAAIPDAIPPNPTSVPPTVATERAPATKPPRPARLAADGVTAELDLVQRAHAAYTRRDFSSALALVAEHARRFPKGHLTEEREALRIRSLVALGRRDEAHRVAAAFAVRFPRSILAPSVEDGAGAPE